MREPRRTRRQPTHREERAALEAAGQLELDLGEAERKVSISTLARAYRDLARSRRGGRT